MMEPSKRTKSTDDLNWSEMNESLRKDVECLFGILKQEFAILKYGCRFSDLSLVDDIFQTCCAIHNQRKIVSGSDQPWSIVELYPDDIDGDSARLRPDVFRRILESERFEEESIGRGSEEHEIIHDDFVLPLHADSHATVKNRLINHFAVACRKNEIFWPRRKSNPLAPLLTRREMRNTSFSPFLALTTRYFSARKNVVVKSPGTTDSSSTITSVIAVDVGSSSAAPSTSNTGFFFSSK
jgi:Plant transposon protein